MVFDRKPQTSLNLVSQAEIRKTTIAKAQIIKLKRCTTLSNLYCFCLNWTAQVSQPCSG